MTEHKSLNVCFFSKFKDGYFTIEQPHAGWEGDACEVCSEGVAATDSRARETRILEGRAFEAAGVFEIKQTSDLLFHSPFLSCKIYSFCLVRVSKRIPTLHEGRSEANFQESGFCFHWTKIGPLCRLCSRTVLQTAPSAVSPHLCLPS